MRQSLGVSAIILAINTAALLINEVSSSAHNPVCNNINLHPLDFNQTVIDRLREPNRPTLVNIDADMMTGSLYMMEVTTSSIHEQKIGVNNRLNKYPYLIREEYSWIDLSYYSIKNNKTGDIIFDEPYNKLRITDNYIFEATDYLRSNQQINTGLFVIPPRFERYHFAAILDTYYTKYKINDYDPIIVDIYHINMNQSQQPFYAVIVNKENDYIISSLSPVKERAIQAHSMKEWGVVC
jgi:hypothetical protein